MEEVYEIRIFVRKQAEIFTRGESYGVFIPLDVDFDRENLRKCGEFLRGKMSRAVKGNLDGETFRKEIG